MLSDKQVDTQFSTQRRKLVFAGAVLWVTVWFGTANPVSLTLTHFTMLDSLGACQGVSVLNGRAYLYGHREVGVIIQYALRAAILTYTSIETKLTKGNKDIMNHPGFRHLDRLFRPNSEHWKLLAAPDWAKQNTDATQPPVSGTTKI